ncbi:hypothetical protein [Pseudooceanicola aestuarii]|uniref:hypothetical protein n=1 Tax=Pseudooceanicola aestuarii TaxID=2697319 RepID=UPI0013D4E998|nr:hypothetical protein [Pseudooceanicola aestuarii]
MTAQMTEDDVRRGLAALGITPAADRLPAITAVVAQNMAWIDIVMAAPLPPRAENAPVWTLPERTPE